MSDEQILKDLQDAIEEMDHIDQSLTETVSSPTFQERLAKLIGGDDERQERNKPSGS